MPQFDKIANALDPGRLSVCMDAFKSAFASTPESMEMKTRVSTALAMLPDEAVDYLADATALLTGCITHRLGLGQEDAFKEAAETMHALGTAWRADA